MWKEEDDLVQRKTLLNKLDSFRRFYFPKMSKSEMCFLFISRVRQLASDCKALDVTIDNLEISMTVHCNLSAKDKHLIVAIDTAADDWKLPIDFVKSRLL